MNKNKFLNIRFDDKEDEIITNKSNELGISKAAAIRTIIREWDKQRKLFMTVPVSGVIQEDGTIKMRPETLEEEIERRR